MKKIIIIVVVLILSLCSILATNFVIKNNINENIDKLKYYNDHDKNYSDFVMEKTITKKDVVVFGSSELILSGYDINEFTHPENLFNQGNSDYNLVLFGRGYTQSLQHAIDLGAVHNNLKNNKVVLILSPQWFTEDNIPGQFFTRNFSDAEYLQFLQNTNISRDLKEDIASRVNEMMEDYQSTYQRVKLYENVYINGSKNPLSYIFTKGYELFANSKHEYALWNKYLKNREVVYRDEYVEIENINFDNLLQEAEIVGSDQCTNNDYAIFDQGFIDNFQSRLDKLKDSEINSTYAISKEYNDLELFIKVCKELNIEPLIVSVPVNGYWYDYVGFPKQGRDMYYEKIRNICSKYDIELADFSDKEYEKYFLRDSMHLGWKGWVYVNEKIYNYYKFK